ncbi:Kelch repeat-containing protein [Brevibacillus borstelensis]|uniref:Kelch repeat-containing protein n=1 Tax=Brevibacillus borstelensis TaxID=45462 RepID=UPI0030BCFD95
MDAIGFALAQSTEPYRWKRISTIPFSDGEMRAEIVGDKVYVISRNYNQVYDLRSGTWAQEPALPEERRRSRFSSCVVGTNIYVIGGSKVIDDNLDDRNTPLFVDIYDTANKKWSILASDTFNVHSAGCAAVGDKIYLFGGANRALYGYQQPLSSARVLDLATSVWSNTAQIPREISEMGIAALDNKIYLLGGYTIISFTNKQLLKEVYAYDITAKTWGRCPDLNSARTALAGASVGKEVFALCGIESAMVESYSPQSNAVAIRQSPTSVRSYFGAVQWNGSIYVFGGDKEHSVEVFQPNGTNMDALLAWLATR